MTISNRIEQNRLLAAIVGRGSREGFEEKGLKAYQRNFKANAARALEISFPVVSQLLGEGAFRQLCVKFLAVHLPETADWGEWGEQFPIWLKEHEISRELPYISDCATLDWLSHQAERAADYKLDVESYQLLANEDAAAGSFSVNPTVQVFESGYPVVDIWLAHNMPGKDRSEFLQEARAKLEAGEGQIVLLWRQHWQAQVRAISSEEHHWLGCLGKGLSLEQSLDQLEQQLPEHRFDFEHWLPGAIESHLIIGFEQEPQLSGKAS